MNRLKQFRPVYLAFGVVAAALLAYGLWTRPQPQPADAEGFSSARVVEHIKEISQKPHSVAPDSAHMAARAEVREYLAGELLDVDGRCGGYNLQWAWSSGVVAGRAASRLECQT